MKAPSPVILRSASALARKPRSRTEAATELVRAEFERERLERDMALLVRRYRISAYARAVAATRSMTLRAALAEETAPETPPRRTVRPGRGTPR